MKLLLDQGLPRSTVDHLKVLGVDAVHVGQIGLCSASDSAILEEARVQNAIVVTHDADFHQLLAISQAKNPSTIRIRIEGLKGEALTEVLTKVLDSAASELKAGAAVSVTPTRIRIRLLPIGR